LLLVSLSPKILWGLFGDVHRFVTRSGALQAVESAASETKLKEEKRG
jgi:hypothetical protein